MITNLDVKIPLFELYYMEKKKGYVWKIISTWQDHRHSSSPSLYFFDQRIGIKFNYDFEKC